MSANWLLYSHDALGLGHARRMTSIARAVLADRPDLSALLVTCSPQIDALPIPPGLDYIKLPSARKLSAQDYVARTLRLDPVRFRALRSGLIEDAVRTYAPELILVDKSPCGLMGELVPTLERLTCEAPRSTRLVLSWRDILDSPERVRAEWRDKRTLEWIERWYEEVWVFGDPEVFDVREAYAMPREFAARVRHLGYLSPDVDDAAIARARIALGGAGPVALVCAGGGEDGEPLLAAWVEAVRARAVPADLRSVLVTGPMMPAEAQRRLRAAAPESVRILPFVPGLEAMIAAADVVVGMAGYNTACEVLGAGTPAVLVPRATQREEQRIRARRLAELGLTECVLPEDLDAQTLAGAAMRMLARGRRARRHMPDLGGLPSASEQVDRLLPPARPRLHCADHVRSGLGVWK